MNNFTLVVLTKDEAVHLERCLKSVGGLASQIIVVDSGSADDTVSIAKRLGAEVFTHPFVNQAEQFNWALDNLEIKGEWILKLDADEYLTPELADEIKNVIGSGSAVSGYLIKRRVYFMGRWMKHGGYYPIWFLRLWRRGMGRSEDRGDGRAYGIARRRGRPPKNDFVDDNRKGLKEWFERHKNYSEREARDVLKGGVANDSNALFITACRLFSGRAFIFLPLLHPARIFGRKRRADFPFSPGILVQIFGGYKAF